jgi:hypothetical protein
MRQEHADGVVRGRVRGSAPRRVGGVQPVRACGRGHRVLLAVIRGDGVTCHAPNAARRLQAESNG